MLLWARAVPKADTISVRGAFKCHTAQEKQNLHQMCHPNTCLIAYSFNYFSRKTKKTPKKTITKVNEWMPHCLLWIAIRKYHVCQRWVWSGRLVPSESDPQGQALRKFLSFLCLTAKLSTKEGSRSYEGNRVFQIQISHFSSCSIQYLRSTSIFM